MTAALNSGEHCTGKTGLSRVNFLPLEEIVNVAIC